MTAMQILSQEEELKFLIEIGGTQRDGHLYGRIGIRHNINMRSWKERRNLCGVLLMLDAGLRVGEVIGVTFEDMYFESSPRDVLLVRAEIAKGRRSRRIPLSARLKLAFERFNSEPYLIVGLPLTQCIMSHEPQGRPLTCRAIQKMTKKAGQLALGFDVNPHMLRHTLATRLMALTDIRTVQQILGHLHVTTTQIYTHPSSEDCRKAIEALSTGKPVGVKLLGVNKEESNELRENFESNQTSKASQTTEGTKL